MMFAFLLLLLTPTGAEICSSCFLDEDVEEPNYDWDCAPGLDLDNVYKPPILHQHVNHSNDICHTLTGNDDDKVQEPEEVPADHSSSDSSEGSTKCPVTNNNKGPITMNCSHCQFVYLLKNLLVFHAMYKCGPPLFGPGSSPSDADNLLLSLCKLLVVQIITYCPRQECNKQKLQKLHELLHFPVMLFFFHHPENFDAVTRERHLKDVFKDVARNSQQWGQDTFLCQVGARMHEKLIMTKAKQFSVGMAEYYSGKQHNAASPSDTGNDITHTLPHNKMYVISYDETNYANGQHTDACCL
jgi:hypothetical protein